MMDKNTLIKRFEDKTKQEIINHNRAIESYHSSIGCLRGDLNSLRKNFQEKMNELHSWIQLEQSGLKEKIQLSLTAIHKADSKCNDSIHSIKVVSDAHNMVKDKVYEISSDVSVLAETVVIQSKSIFNLSQHVEQIKTGFFNEIERLKNVFTDRHADFLKENSIKPKEVEILGDRLDYQIDIVKCNQTGTHDELEIVKKDVKYMKKQIENIYTLLDRINDKLGE